MQGDSPRVADTVRDVLDVALIDVVGLIEEEGECARLRASTRQYRDQHFCLDSATATSDGGGARPYPLRDLGVASPSRSCRRQPITRWCSEDCTRGRQGCR